MYHQTRFYTLKCTKGNQGMNYENALDLQWEVCGTWSNESLV